MKKGLLFILTLSILFFCVVYFTGCENRHEHNLYDGWAYDDNYHWHYCMLHSCQEIFDKAEHNWSENEQGGEPSYICDVCGAIKENPDTNTGTTNIETSEGSSAEELIFVSNGNGTCYVSGIGAFNGGHLNIPSVSSKGDTVTGIGDFFSFTGGEKITSVTIPDSVTVIGSDAFWYCVNLESVTFGNSVEKIGNRAFQGCFKLKDITLPNSITTIGDKAFMQCHGITSILLPPAITSIGSRVFSECSGLSSIYITDNIATIGDSAFENCTSLSSVKLGSSLKSVGRGAFSGCQNLKDIYISDVAMWLNLSFFENETNRDFYETLHFVNENDNEITELIIPDTTTVIDEYAFHNAKNLTKITIPNTVTKICDFAFMNCESLISIEIPNNVQTLGSGLFFDCKSLTSVTIGKGVNDAGESIFFGCENLKDIYIRDIKSWLNISSHHMNSYYDIYAKKHIIDNTGKPVSNAQIPAGTTYIGPGSFLGCEEIEQITIPSTVTEIGYAAFYECSNLTKIIWEDDSKCSQIGERSFYNCSKITDLTIPKSVESIEAFAFDGCSNITEVVIDGGVQTLGEFAFNCPNIEEIYITDIDSWLKGPFRPDRFYSEDSCSTKLYIVDNRGIEITEITIPKEIESIIDGAFYNCVNLEKVFFEENSTLKNIGPQAFSGCVNLISINIPNSTTHIGYESFIGCDNLEAIVLPSSVKEIGMSAFGGCKKLQSVTFEGYVASIERYAFHESFNISSVYISDMSTWCKTSFDEGSNPLCYGAKLYLNGSLVEELFVPETVTKIGDHIFEGCSSIKQVHLSNQVTEIGTQAFYNCSSLESIEIPESVKEIGWLAFGNCENLAYNTYKDASYLGNVQNPYVVFVSVPYDLPSYQIHPDTKVILDYAFKQCRVENLAIPDGVVSIGEQAFSSCTELTSITIPDSVTNIGNNAFDNTGYYNNEANWEDGVLYIGNYLIEAKDTISGTYTVKNGTKMIAPDAFSECDGLTSVIIPDSVTNIGATAFAYCDGLTSITIGNSVTNIGERAFCRCDRLTSIAFNGTQAKWREISKGLSWNNHVPATKIICSDGEIEI